MLTTIDQSKITLPWHFVIGLFHCTFISVVKQLNVIDFYSLIIINLDEKV